MKNLLYPFLFFLPIFCFSKEPDLIGFKANSSLSYGISKTSFPKQTFDISDDAFGNIWVSSEIGVYVYDRIKYSRIKWFDDKQEVLKIFKRGVVLYFMHKNLDVSVYNGSKFFYSKFLNFEDNQKPKVSRIRDIQIDEKVNKVYCLAEFYKVGLNGLNLIVIDLRFPKSILYKVNELKCVNISNISKISKSCFYFESNETVESIDRLKNQVDLSVVQNGNKTIRKTVKTNYHLWIDNKTIKLINLKSNLYRKINYQGLISNLIVDFEGNLWLATQSDGVVFYDMNYNIDSYRDISVVNYGYRIKVLNGLIGKDSLMYSKRHGFHKTNSKIDNLNVIYSDSKIEYVDSINRFIIGYSSFYFNNMIFNLSSKINDHLYLFKDFYLSTNKGLYKYDVQSHSLFRLFNNEVTQIISDGIRLFFVSNNDIYAYDFNSRNIKLFFKEDISIHSILLDSNVFYYTTDFGLFHIENDASSVKISDKLYIKQMCLINGSFMCSDGSTIYKINKNIYKTPGKSILSVLKFNQIDNVIKTHKNISFYAYVKSEYNKNSKIKYTLFRHNDTLLNQISNHGWVNITNLNHGEYKLKLIGVNDLGVSSYPSEIDFEIEPHTFQTVEFKSSIFAISGSFVIVFLHILRKRRMNRKLIIENENYNLQLLKAQLNPHFLFNAINSMKSLIYKADVSKAIDYSDRLSSFLRSILSFNQILETSLFMEIELIKYYIGIENSRLDERISFDIHSSAPIDDILIPSNILQPIVENSIKYGIVNDYGKLSVSLDFGIEDSILTITIEDNSTGDSETNNHGNSFSINSIYRRIDSFNNKKIPEALRLTPLYFEGKKCGMQTEIKLQLKYA